MNILFILQKYLNKIGKNKGENMSISIHLSIECDVGTKQPYGVGLYSGNMTHNVVPMWKKAKVYNAIYMSKDKKAKDIIKELKIGLKHMSSNPYDYILLNPDNKWRSYEVALEFLEEFTKACIAYPKATISTCQ